MDVDGTALILEGGGLRGIYTSGVLRFFMDRKWSFPYVIGVSMGACNGANFISRQPERNRIVNTRFVHDPRYISYFRLFTGGDLFGMDFIFNTIPNDLVPFDNETFFNNTAQFIVVVTDCQSGEAMYYEKNEFKGDELTLLQASCSLPFISKPVFYDGYLLMDGGLSDSIPIEKSLLDGNNKNVLILTQPKGFRKKPSKVMNLTKIWYPKLVGLQNALETRHIRYNKTMDLIDDLEEQREIFVIRPRKSLDADRVERNKDKLYRVYDQGYENASLMETDLMEYIGGK